MYLTLTVSFTDEVVEVQRGEVTCPGLCSRSVDKQVSNLGLPDSKAHTLSLSHSKAWSQASNGNHPI